MILGRAFTYDPRALLSSIPYSDTVSTLTLKNAVHDETYVSTDVISTDDYDGSIPKTWTFDTRLHATYKNELYGGNVKFSESITEYVRIKKRTDKDSRFQTIYEKKIDSNEDFEIHLVDYIEPVGTIEYAYVPVISGGENNYIAASVESKFNDYFLVERDVSYPLILDAQFTRTLNQQVGVVETWGRQKPVIIKNGNLKYYSGDIECTFIQGVDCDWDIDNALAYRDQIYDFLVDGQPKILKDPKGDNYMIAVTSNISESIEAPRIIKSSFSVTECGDAYECGSLYDNGFIDTDVDR